MSNVPGCHQWKRVLPSLFPVPHSFSLLLLTFLLLFKNRIHRTDYPHLLVHLCLGRKEIISLILHCFYIVIVTKFKTVRENYQQLLINALENIYSFQHRFRECKSDICHFHSNKLLFSCCFQKKKRLSLIFNLLSIEKTMSCPP